MTNIWDDLKKNLTQWSNVAVEKAEEMSKIAVAKTEELTRISKIKIEIRQLQKDIDKTYEELGRLVRKGADEKNLDFSGNTSVGEFLAKVSDTETIISEKEAQIQKIKEEYDLKESDLKESEVAGTEPEAGSAAPEEKAEKEPAPAKKKKPKAKKKAAKKCLPRYL